MGKDFFTVKLKNNEKNILFHAPTSSVMLVDSNETITDLSDEALYKRIPGILEKPVVKEEVRNIREGKLGITFMSSRCCNLRCTYCFAGEGEYGKREDKPSVMSCDTYMKAIYEGLSLYPDGIKSVSFFGGEPLLNWVEIKKFLPQLTSYMKTNNMEMPGIGISTNGTIMNDEIAQYIKKYNISVALSLDGTKTLNDSSRKSKHDEYSVYDKVVSCTKLLKQYEISYLVEMTITKKHLDQYKPGVFCEWLEELDLLDCVNTVIVPVESDDPDLGIKNDADLHTLDLIGRELTNYYINELYKKNPKRISTLFTNTLIQLAKNTGYTGCNAGKHLFVDTDGKLYPCHMFCNDKAFVLGDLNESVYDCKKMKEMIDINRSGDRECSNCMSRKVCVYWCKGLQYLNYGDMYKVIKARCVFQKAIMEEGIVAYSKLNQDKEQYKLFIKNLGDIYEKVRHDMRISV